MSTKSSNSKNFVRVNFTNRGLSKAFSAPLSPESTTPDKQNVLQMSKILSDVKIQRGTPQSFRSLPEFSGVDYIGYVIEKERLDQSTGQWVRIDEYKIIGSDANSFVDTRIVYGNFYRYRIKSILKLTKQEEKNDLSIFDAVQNIKDFESQKIQDSLVENTPILSDLGKFTNLGLSSKTSSGEKTKSIALIDGVDFVATKSSTSIVQSSPLVSFNLRAEKNLATTAGTIKGNLSDSALQQEINKSLQKTKLTKKGYYSYYFESNPSKNWIYIDVVDKTPPPPPQTISVVPNSTKKEIAISWLPPANSQRDIKYFKIYKRKKIGNPWALITKTREIDVDMNGVVDEVDENDSHIPVNTNLYTDRNVKFGEMYIYALSCVDIHGIESFLSIQTGAELNSSYDIDKAEKPLKWMGGSGTRIDEVSSVVKKFYNRSEQIIAKKSITISPDTKLDSEKNLLIKIKSLDTHDVVEVNVVLKNINLNKDKDL
jgi:hypothetical protein